jgi:hypothetical protein
MRCGIVVFMVLLGISLVFLGSDHQMAQGEEGQWVVVNVDGDASFSAAVDRGFWNPHVCGFTKAVEWSVSFSDWVSVRLRTPGGGEGHVATGMWWTSGFAGGETIPLHDTRVRVDFDAQVSTFKYEAPGDWLRIALACAVQRGSGAVVYTEMDFSDSPGAQRHPRGNLPGGGDVVYQLGDVVEFKVDEAPLDEWRHYQIDVTGYIDRAWVLRVGDRLESVYVVVECGGGPGEVEVQIDNLWIQVLSDA